LISIYKYLIAIIHYMEEIHYLLGNACNLDCDFCFWDIRMPDVSLDAKKRIIDQIVKTGISRVTVSGGEPLCSDNFLEVMDYMHKKDLEVILHTNGLKIDGATAKKIAPLVSRVSLTLDGISKETMVRMRKNSEITGHTLFLIGIFHSLGVPVNVKTLVTKANQDEIAAIGRTLNGMPVQYWSLLEFNPINRGRTNIGKFLISSKKFDEICLKAKNGFPSLDVRMRKYKNAESKYCFIAPNGEVYTHVTDKGDVKIGDLKHDELSSLISKIENPSS